ncbi:SixA phosphatase family protein [Nakamurella alba]|uniref:SixA phosphatase family protein n=1 Tax=Nakamurella alba TaxID=2665158 RepID=UPI002AC325C4|nr:histidine phosphatase family protein [Nakamurella alba]
MPSTSRTLVLLRHGKSGYPPGVPDHDRPLALRGEREAALAGAWIAAELDPVQAVICSTAVRTRQTLERTGLAVAPDRIDVSSRVYEADPEDVLAEIRLTAADVAVLLVVGHAPGLPGLTEQLAGPGSDPAALRAATEHFPTSAMAVFAVDGDWADLGPGGAALQHFEVARA